MRRLGVAIAVALALGGCAKVGTTTSLRPDGSFDRKVVYTLSATPPTGDPNAKPVTLDTLFKIPAANAGVKVQRTGDESKKVATVDRTIAAGADALQDITLMTDDGKPMMTSSVTVRKLPNGQIEYMETLHWVGPKADDKAFDTSTLRPTLKQILPPEYQSTETLDKAVRLLTVGAVHVLIGPPEPTVFDVALNQDAAVRRLARMLLPAYAEALRKAIPAMSLADRTLAARKLLKAFGPEQMNPMSATKPGEMPENPSKKSGQNGMTPLFFEVAFPGKVVETDGLTDVLTGNVYWSLFAPAVEIEDVKLRAVVAP